MKRKTAKKIIPLVLAVLILAIASALYAAGKIEKKPGSGEVAKSQASDNEQDPIPSPSPLGEDETLVSDGTQLGAAFAHAKPGDTIVLADGTWRDTIITFKAESTAEKPVKLRAQSPGKVILAGNSRLALESPYLIVDGLLFKDGSPKDKKPVVSFNSDHGQVTNTAVIGFNPDKPDTGYYWVYFKGNYNQLDSSLFQGKNNTQPLVGNDPKGKYNKVESCYFKDIPYIPNLNGREIFRIWGYGGNDELGTDGAFFTIEHNLFERAHGEGVEIISLKSNNNLVRFNTIVETRGGITGRSGNTNTIEGNIILGNNAAGTKGVRITGHHMKVINNYVENVQETALEMMSGEHIFNDQHQLEYLTPQFVPLPRVGSPYGYVVNYGQVRESLIEGNTFVNNRSTDLVIGSSYKSKWPANQMVLLPENNRFAHNLIYKPTGGKAIQMTVQDMQPPFGTFTFQPNQFEDNRIIGNQVAADLPKGTEGVKVDTATNSAPPAVPKRLTSQDVGPRWSRTDPSPK